MKSGNVMASGYFYAPYVPLTQTPVVGDYLDRNLFLILVQVFSIQRELISSTILYNFGKKFVHIVGSGEKFTIYDKVVNKKFDLADPNLIKSVYEFVDSLDPANMVGWNEGNICLRNGCTGVLTFKSLECTCRTMAKPPCSNCTDSIIYCPSCDWHRDDG